MCSLREPGGVSVSPVRCACIPATSALPNRAGLLFDVASERLREIGHQAAEAVMIGNDYRNDIHPAARSGFMTVHAALDRRSWVSAGDESPRADAIVTSLTGLASLIAEAR